MFTGIIEEFGRLAGRRRVAGGMELEIGCRRVLEDLKPEDSLAVNGACLTVIRVAGGAAFVEAVPETLEKTTIGGLASGTQLHLERAVLPTTRMGGHYVQGHVDCVARVRSVAVEGLGKSLVVAFPGEFRRYTPRTGSICLDGVSLTIAGEPEIVGDEALLRVALIPYTLEHTLLGGHRPGEQINVEFDCLAKYLEQLLKDGAGLDGKAGGLSMDRLRELGY